MFIHFKINSPKNLVGINCVPCVQVRQYKLSNVVLFPELNMQTLLFVVTQNNLS